MWGGQTVYYNKNILSDIQAKSKLTKLMETIPNEFKTGETVVDLDHIEYGKGFITATHTGYLCVRFKNKDHTIHGSSVYLIDNNTLVYPEVIQNLSLIKSQLKFLKDD